MKLVKIKQMIFEIKFLVQAFINLCNLIIIKDIKF